MNQVGQLNGHSSSSSLAGVSAAANGQLSLPLNGQIKGRPPQCLNFKGAQAWDICDRVIYIERSHLDRWLENWTKKSICVKCCADNHHFVFLRWLNYLVPVTVHANQLPYRTWYWNMFLIYRIPDGCNLAIFIFSTGSYAWSFFYTVPTGVHYRSIKPPSYLVWPQRR